MTDAASFSRRLRTSVAIGVAAFIVYNANLRAISAADCWPARYLPFAILRHHTLFLNPVATIAAQGRRDDVFWMVPLPNGHLVSLYPVVVPVLVTPLYLPAAAYLHFKGWNDARLDNAARLMEKLSASLIAALSVSLLYLLLRRRARESVALLLTAAYAFGTTTWVVSSQALWQHGMAELLVIAALLVLTGPCSGPRALVLGLLLGLIAANRPPDAVLAAALGIPALFWAGRRRLALLIGGAALPTILLLTYNLGVIGKFEGGYGLIGKGTFFKHDILPGLAGLLISPTRGLFLFSPFLLLVLAAWPRLWRNRDERLLALAMSISIVVQVLVYAKADWRGGESWGPRYMTDLLPFLFWMLVPVVSALRGIGRMLFQAAVAFSIVIEAIGAFTYAGWMDAPIVAILWGPGAMDAAFDRHNIPFVVSIRHGLAPPELLTAVSGSFDGFESDGQQTFATGWALAGHATPWQAAVLIDGRQTAATRTFIERGDVRNALHETSNAGWRIPIDTASLTPGGHKLAALAWASEFSDAHLIGARTLSVRTPAATLGRASSLPDLAPAATAAAARIAGHQQLDGYWLTAFTSGTSFRDPHPEMNTFLTALLVDLLEPIATKTRLDDSLLRARQHLIRQIEPNGLVRYHGLPSGIGIGTLGCVITPDVDDTALVWRTAPPDRRLDTALSLIDRYKTSGGLYRNWLAPREAYQCLDPGRNPNPTDLTIQMHLLLLLAQVRPPAAHALCDALRPVVDDDRVWVYYRKTPLVAILRLSDLRRAGCALELPESRMQASVAGQQIWVAVARMLDGLSRGTAPPPDAAMARALLRELARDDFALLRTAPPLLYHNDLTATVSRYYWSEDVGYALWLRLYDQYELLGHPPPAR